MWYCVSGQRTFSPLTILRCLLKLMDYALAFFFFFKQKTAYEFVDCDWSSDVCSSDLRIEAAAKQASTLGLAAASMRDRCSINR